MKIIDCDKKKNNISQIHRNLRKLLEKVIEHKIFVDKNCTFEDFLKMSEENMLYMKSFLHDIDIKVACAFIDVNHIQFNIVFKYLRKKKKKVVQIVNEFIRELENIMSYFDKIEVIGKTRDDAAGEAFDKVSKMLGLGYPGGAVIDKLASSIEESEFKFSCAKLKDTLDFSFSGIKTAVLYKVSKIKLMTNLINAQIAYSFQKQVTDIITEKSILACEKFQTNRLCVGGGVTCNSSLRYKLKKQAKTKGIKLLLSKPKFCTDNAAMIAMLGYYLHCKGVRSEYQLDAKAVA